jgi:hypothetical protein
MIFAEDMALLPAIGTILRRNGAKCGDTSKRTFVSVSGNRERFDFTSNVGWVVDRYDEESA